ncbi:transcriptional regulator GcvA [Labrys sp. KB_33_2]|uniref:transcriptional regulator GcvA n=1 Tax=Labrys sp. KB_33_2 TaxID=3237479 RepID=UPI003F8E2F01
MRYRLPPLNALRAFEAAARLVSFRLAAAELNVTPGAVSQQIKRLEADLGFQLFSRTPTSLRLTQAGQEYFPIIRQVFGQISEETQRLTNRGRKADVVTVSVMPGFAIKWLVPRLGRFQARHPDIEVRINASTELVDFERNDVDLAIRHGLGHYPGLKSWLLLSEDMVPVCHPRLLEGQHPLNAIEDIRHHTLLHDQDQRDWRLWLQAAKVTGIDTSRGPRFNDESVMLQAAIEGQGIALCHSTLVERDVIEGRLVKIFEVHAPSDFAHYIVCPEGRAELRKLVTFREWLLQDANTFQRLAEATNKE